MPPSSGNLELPDWIIAVLAALAFVPITGMYAICLFSSLCDRGDNFGMVALPFYFLLPIVAVSSLGLWAVRLAMRTKPFTGHVRTLYFIILVMLLLTSPF